MESKENKVSVTITLDKDIFNKFREACNKSGHKISSLINLILRKFLSDLDSGDIELFSQEKKEDKKDKK